MAMEDKEKINTFIKGLNKDVYELNQDNSSYTFALNAVNESSTGDLSTLINETGNIECLDLPKNTFPIGSILLNSEEIILFLKDKEDTVNSIILANLNKCSYQTIVSNTCLNFQRQIQGVQRTLNGCDRIIYFVDGINPDRVINIDDILRNPTSHNYLNKYGFFDCNLIKNKRDISVASIENVVVNNSGGNLGLGVYQIILQLEDNFGNGSDYFGYSLPIPIIYGNYGGDYKNMMGGDPLLFPVTNKSITFDIKNIDLSYDYLNIIVGYTKNSVTSYYKVEKIGIVNDNITYTLSDITMDGTIQIPYDELIISNNPYDVSETITQTDNRLIKGNVKGKVRDYSEFQRLAANIKVNYVTKPIKHSAENSLSTSGLSKSSTAYMEYRTEMRDEIYSLALVGVFKDGTETPAFHICGRAKNTANKLSSFPTSDDNTHVRPNNNTGNTDTGWDSALIFAEDGSGNLLPDFKFLIDSDFTLIGGERYVERWKVYNTAYRTELNTTSSQYYSKGELAYYESEDRYPVIKDCSGNYVYPTEVLNGKIVGQKIRHHKMPDTTLEEHFTIDDSGNNYILPLGLEFSNIYLPAQYQNELVGYYIVKELRTQNNKTIIDKGLIYENAIINDIHVFSNDNADWYVQTTIAGRHHREQGTSFPFIPNYSSIDESCGDTHGDAASYIYYNHKCNSFHGAVAKFLNSAFSSSFFKNERVIKGNIESWSNVKSSDEISRYYKHAIYNNSYLNPAQGTNFTLEKDPIYIKADNELAPGYLDLHFLNNNAQDTCVFKTQDEVLYVSEFDAFTTGEINALYGSMKSYNRNMYGSIGLRKYYKMHNKIINKNTHSTILFGGDCFISKFSFFSSAFTKKCDGDESISFDVNKTMITYFVESEINTELRHLDITNVTDKNNNFWDYYNGTYIEFFNLDWNGYSINFDDLTNGGTSAWYNNVYMKNLYLYNKDYSKSDSVKPYFSLDINFEYCKDCREQFPTRIIYSEQGNQEQTRDTYRIFLANNYRDLPAHTGELTNLFINFDELYAHTKQSLYKIVTKPYQINTDQTTLYVGTGEFFSVPPRELISTTYGYGGSNCKWGTITTEFGTVYIDDLTGKIFQLSIGDKGQSINKEISSQGMRNWFEENLEINFNKQWQRLFNENYEKNNQPALINGIGFLTTYDPRHKRIIITKKDYRILEEKTFNPSRPFNLTDTTRFENLSWTISYSLLNEAWLSFYSYLPNFYFNDANTFYSSRNSVNNKYDTLDINLSMMWKHNEGEQQKFYNKKQDFIIEYIDRNPITDSLDSLYWLSHTQLYDSLMKYYSEVEDVTFTKGMVYTPVQSSGKFTIVPETNPYQNINWSNTQKMCKRTDRNWKLSGIRDLSIKSNVPSLTSKWQDIKSYFINDGYIDKIQNPDLINVNKNMYELADIKDKIKFIRLFFENKENNYKFKIFLTGNNSSISIR